jgi:beta-lactamase regulating signal transducer with metallopeptidase domain
MNAEFESVCHRLLGALFNGTYQGLVLTVFIWALLRFLPQTNAATRHAAALVALTLIALLPLFHFLAPSNRGDWVATLPEESSTQTAAAQPPFERSNDGSMPESKGIFSEAISPMLSAPDAEWPGTGELWAAPIESFPELNPGEAAGILNEPPALEPKLSAATEPAFSFATFLSSLRRQWLLAAPKWITVTLVLAWGFIAALRVLNLFRQCGLLRVWKRYGISPSLELQQMFERLCQQMNVSRKPRLTICSHVAAPMAVGFWQPAVLLPLKVFTAAEEAQVEQILRHELAHVRRRDDWSNLFQQLIRAVLFFHPGVWWLSRRLTIEREIACDDHVLAALGAPRAYALFLTEFASRKDGRDWAVAPAAWSHKSQLKERIHMILDLKRNSSVRVAGGSVGALTIATSLLALLAVLSGPRVALAQSAGAATGSDTPSASVTAPVTASASAPTVRTDLDVDVDVDMDLDRAVELELGEPEIGVAVNIVPPVPAAPPNPPHLPETPAKVKEPKGNLPAVNHPAPPPAPPAARVPHPPRAVIAANQAVIAHPNIPGAQVRAVGSAEAPGESAKKGKEQSLERRIERLERLVNEMAGKQQWNRSPGASENRFHYEMRGPGAQEQSSEFKWEAKPPKGAKEEEKIEIIKNEAKRQADRAVRDAARAMKEVERSAAHREHDVRMNELHASMKELGSDARQQRKVLEGQRRALEKQLEAIEKQLERLEEQQEKQKSERQKELPQPKPVPEPSEPQNTPEPPKVKR